MNFLGHCYLCGNHTELLAGNLGGDFYKGNLDKFNELPKHILDGVRLHRFIDEFTDQSSEINAVAQIFKDDGIQKVSFIACDILLDHYLTKHWNEYHQLPYSDYVESTFARINDDQHHLTADFQWLFDRMKALKWFYAYPSTDGIRMILQQFSQRIGFNNELARSVDTYLAKQETIDIHFKSFLNAVKPAAELFIVENKLGNS